MLAQAHCIAFPASVVLFAIKAKDGQSRIEVEA